MLADNNVFTDNEEIDVYDDVSSDNRKMAADYDDLSIYNKEEVAVHDAVSINDEEVNVSDDVSSDIKEVAVDDEVSNNNEEVADSVTGEPDTTGGVLKLYHLLTAASFQPSRAHMIFTRGAAMHTYHECSF